MTIDEAIKRLRSYEIINSMREKRQIADWLEELKAYKEKYGNIVNLIEWENHIRATAIDDFAEKLITEYDFGDCENEIKEVAEQLKAGGTNE